MEVGGGVSGFYTDQQIDEEVDRIVEWLRAEYLRRSREFYAREGHSGFIEDWDDAADAIERREYRNGQH